MDEVASSNLAEPITSHERTAPFAIRKLLASGAVGGGMRQAGLLLLAILLVPVAAADPAPQDLCVITIRPNEEFSQVVVRVDEIYNETLKEDLAQALDADGDGYVYPEEEAAYEAASVTVFNQSGPSDLGAKRLFLDEKEPRRVVFEKDLSNVVGPVNQTDAWLVTEVRTYDFEAEELRTHRIQGGNESNPEARAIVEFVVVEAPPGWWVHRVNETLYDNHSVALPAFDTRQHFRIDFSDEPGLDYFLPARGSPGFEAGFLVIAAIGALAAGRRWRR